MLISNFCIIGKVTQLALNLIMKFPSLATVKSMWLAGSATNSRYTTCNWSPPPPLPVYTWPPCYYSPTTLPPGGGEGGGPACRCLHSCNSLQQIVIKKKLLLYVYFSKLWSLLRKSNIFGHSSFWVPDLFYALSASSELQISLDYLFTLSLSMI
jgi:hypothetical protein